MPEHATGSRAAWWRTDPEWVEFVASFEDKDVRFSLDEAAALLEARRNATPDRAAKKLISGAYPENYREGNVPLDTDACEWCSTWEPTPDNPCAYCNRGAS